MKSDVVLNKIGVIQRCVHRIQEEYDNTPSNIKNNTKQDSIILNIQRACEASIDLAMHIVSERQLGLPQSERDAFELLQIHSIIDEEMAKRLIATIGFSYKIVYDYQTIHLAVLQQIIEKHLDDFINFTRQILTL